ncbi:MAG: response regulator, partial [Asticcacaulis sp.]|nr:response regulator [Asticcacaulis sp.]
MPAVSRTVLFLDDDPDILASADLALRRHGYTVTGTQSPEAARERLDAERFDLILLDLNYRRG